MASARTIRLAGVAGIVIFTWMVLQVFRSQGQGTGKIAKMNKDPLLDSELKFRLLSSRG
jgi:hypothetical protein